MRRCTTIVALSRYSLFAMIVATAIPWLVLVLLLSRCEIADNGPVYTVATLRIRLRQDPATWSNRIVRVRGVPGVCDAWNPVRVGSCTLWYPGLIDVRAAPRSAAQHTIHVAGRTVITLAPVDAIPLVRQSAPPLSRFLRSLPFLGRFAPTPRTVQ